MKKIYITILIFFGILLINCFTNINEVSAVQIIENGIYEIETGVDSNKVLEVIDAKKTSGANVQIFTRNNEADCQKVNVKYIGAGYYTIEFLHSGMLLDVADGKTANGTNVWQCRANDSDAQKWLIQDAGDGYYRLISKNSKKYLTVEEGRKANCTNIEINEKNNTNSQKFKFNKIDGIAGLQTIEDGLYEIQTGVDQNKVLEVIDAKKTSGANVQIFTRNNEADCQKVNVKYEGEGYYTIQFLHSKMLLDVADGKTANGTNVWQCRPNGSDAQKWIIQDTGDGYYRLISKSSEKYLTVAGGRTSNCTNIEINEKNNTNSQKFKFNKIELKTKTIEDGLYEIQTGVDSNKVLEVIDAKKTSGANVQIFTRNKNATCQKVNVKYAGDGYYTIEFLHSKMLLDVEDGKTANGTNVWQCRPNGSDAQKWIIQDIGNGYYRLISKNSGKYLTVAGGKTANCTNIEINEANSDGSQRFKFNKIDTTIRLQTIEDGIYEIETGVDSNKVLEVIDARKTSGANVQIFTRNLDAACQKVNVKYVGDGYYTIEFLHSKMLLDVADGKIANGTNVWQCRPNGSDAQKWIIQDAGSGYYRLISKSSEKYLTVAGGKTANCTNIEIYEKNNTNSQKFKFNKVEREIGLQTIEDGLYEIETRVDSNKVLEVIDARKTSGANVQIFTRNNANCQKVNVKYVGDGYYTIEFSHSGMLLDVADGKTANGTNVWQCRPNGSDAQKWIIQDAGSGYYRLISKNSRKYLTVAGGRTANCTNIEIYEKNNTNSQKFKFNKTKRNNTIEIDTSKYPGYKEQIEGLLDAHPNWNFEFLYTGVKFQNAVSGEYSNERRNLVPMDYSGQWVRPNSGIYDSGWYSASEKAIAYYMDSRNFLNDTDIFQFQKLNTYLPNACSLDGIKKQVSGTFLANYADEIDNACRNTNVNSYFIIARLFQEQGRNGTTIGRGMDGGDGKTYYNPFNIGATGDGYENIYANALARAKREGWDTMQKALEGGIYFCKANWLENCQNTLYQNRFDIDSRNGTPLYTHQYMQNLMGAYSEARILANCYSSTGKKDSEFTFIIPLYEDMPQAASEMPSNSTDSYPINVKVDGTNVRFRKESNTNSEIIRELNNGEILLSVERGVNGNWNLVITQDGTIGYVSGDYLKQIDDVTNCNITMKVKTNDGNGCYVRIGPSTRLNKLTALADNTQVTVINKGTYNNIDGYDWYRIVLSDGRQAFIPGKYLANI